MRLAAITCALAAVVAVAPALARATTAPPVSWCGTGLSTTDRPDAVAGRQIHVIYAYPSDGVDRFSIFGSAISTDIGAIDAWWRGQDPTRTPRFDFANFGCPGTFGSLDISDVKLPHDAAYYYDETQRLAEVDTDLATAGFDNQYKKYLVYYDTPQPLPPDVCGQGYDDPQAGSIRGYAAVWIAPNLESGPFESGCGKMEDASDLGGYSAITAAHELLHTLGALDTWDSPGPPHACPTTPAHACDNPLDIMEPAGTTYWLDETFLDWNHDDYYAHSGTWWDVQDSPFLRHLDQPTYTLTVHEGAGVAAVASDVPGVACTPTDTCASTWDAGSTFALDVQPAPGYTNVLWSSACAAAGTSDTCQLNMAANTDVTVSFLRRLAGGAFHAVFQRHPSRVQARLALSRAPVAGEATIACTGSAGLKLTRKTITRTAAVCRWSVAKRFAGKRVSGRVSVALSDGRTLARPFSLRLPKKI